MTRIDFYILPDTELPARDHFACRLLHKVCRRGMRAYLHCDSEESAHRLDELLWSFRDTSFLPHKLAGSAGAPCAIEIGYGNDPGDHHDLLVNLAYAIPSFFSAFDRVVEIAIQEPGVLDATRIHYRQYQHKQYPLQKHDLRTPQRPSPV